MRRVLISVVLLAVVSAHGAVPPDSPTACWEQRKHGRRADAQACFANLARSGDAYIRAEGLWGLEQWEQANEQFRLATHPENSKPLYKVRWGMLLHERFNDGEAADLFREALAWPLSPPRASAVRPPCTG